MRQNRSKKSPIFILMDRRNSPFIKHESYRSRILREAVQNRNSLKLRDIHMFPFRKERKDGRKKGQDLYFRGYRKKRKERPTVSVY